MRFRRFLIGILTFPVFSAVLVNALYFPTAEVNLTLPVWTRSTNRPLPPLMTLRAVGAEGMKGGDVAYGVVWESAPGLFKLVGDELRLKEDVVTGEGEFVARRESVVVRGRGSVVGGGGGEGGEGRARLNLFLSGEEADCGELKRSLCFWEGASYRIGEEEPPTELGQLSSGVLADICRNYSIGYEIYKGKEYVGVDRREGGGEWILSTRRRMGGGGGRKIPFGVKCRVVSGEGSEDILREFELTVVAVGEEVEMTFEVVYEVPRTNVIRENERVARGEIRNPGEERLEVSLEEREGLLDLKCSTGKEFNGSYECEITTRKSFHLRSAYTAIVRAKEASSHRSVSQNITLFPSEPPLETLSLMLSTNPEESFLMDVKYPEWAEVSRRAVVGTRVAEPMVGGVGGGEARRRVVRGGIKFEMVSGGALNVTREGGIVFVWRRNELKEATYRVKISGVYPNGYRFISTMQVNVSETATGAGEDPCEKQGDERPSCSEKRFKSECEKTCGVSSGILRRTAGRPPVTVGCSWRSNEKPEKLSRMYQTCSPDLSTCPDRFCDPLEMLFPKICPQDCTEYVFGSANKENHVPGIASATGVCSCDSRQKCVCALLTKSEPAKQSERRKSKEVSAPRQKEAISAVKASSVDQCGLVCLLSIVGGSAILILGLSGILLVIYRRRMKKRCPNQRPLKEDMVNINYEDYVERPSDVLRPLTQGKEVPEYFDKKWEFPRHRLRIEETIGEGEFGKVLKARADGIGGLEGSVTVAVKTLKDNAKESELADLVSEYQLLKEIEHPNVIRLLGACTKLDGPLYVIIEYAKHGSLRNYLRKHRHGGGEGGVVTPKDILTFAWQIAKGMSYLTEMKLVHRDLAARNVLVGEGLICKISDFGLTRDIYEDDTYLKRSKGRVPVKWMALESLADHVYTTKSDVWSYGVVLWELVTTGASPYPGIAGQDLFNLLKSGYRMEKPANCSNELYQILRSCWHESPSHRPTFKSLVAKLEEMLGEGKEYLDLNPRTAENKTYFGDFIREEREREGEGEGVFAVEFQMFERGKKCERCGVGGCGCGARYENEGVGGRVQYENEGMEDTGYVQPTGRPKPVGSEEVEEKGDLEGGFDGDEI